MRVKKHLAEKKEASLGGKKCMSIAIYMYLHTLLIIYIYMSQFYTGFYVRGGKHLS